MSVLKQSTVIRRPFLLVQSADHITGLTGATPTVTISKNGAALASPGGTVTEIGSGWYYISYTGTDTNTLGPLVAHVTAASADPSDFYDDVQTHILSDFAIDANGNVSITSNIKQNTAATIEFPMVSTTTGQLATGLTVTAQRSLAGAGFAPCANAVTEIATASGVYSLVLAAADTNAVSVVLLLTATNANPVVYQFNTQP